jgi:hypothetical protein
LVKQEALQRSRVILRNQLEKARNGYIAVKNEAPITRTGDQIAKEHEQRWNFSRLWAR